MKTVVSNTCLSINLKGEMYMTTMTFQNAHHSPYRVALDTNKQVFMAYDAKNNQKVAYGITIEQAVQALQKLS